MPNEEIQNQIDELRNDLNAFKLHDHFFSGEKLFLKNHLNFGYQQASVVIPSNDALADTRYGTFFVADYDIEIISASEVHRAFATAADTLDVYKATSGQTSATATTVLVSTFTLNSTAETPVRKTPTAVKSNRILKRGDRLMLVTTGTLAGLEHVVVTVYYLPLGINPQNS